jgi:hypothetical protein
MQIEKHIICINDEIEVNQVREERENPSMQIEVGKVLNKFDEEKTEQFFQKL